MSLIVVDVNSHHSRWDKNPSDDERGEQFSEEIDAADCTILKENEATRLATNGRSTSPDITLASNDIALLPDWSVSTSLTSYHMPILITINSELSTIDGPRRTYINFMTVDWARYAGACEEYLSEAGDTRTVKQSKKTFRKAVKKASGIFIAAGRIRHFQPTLQASALSFADERGRECRLNPAE